MPKISRSSYSSTFCRSDPTAEKLKVKKNIPESFNQFHLEFLCVYVFVKFRYVRNLFRKDSNFQKKNFTRSTFDYEFANQNETPSRFLTIQKELTRYNHLLDKTSNIVENYINFVKDSMEELVEDLIIPIDDVFPEIQEIVDKYKKKKPSRLNMDVVRRLLGEI